MCPPVIVISWFSYVGINQCWAVLSFSSTRNWIGYICPLDHRRFWTNRITILTYNCGSQNGKRIGFEEPHLKPWVCQLTLSWNQEVHWNFLSKYGNFPQNMANFAKITPKRHSASDKNLPKKNNGANNLTIIPFYKLLVFLL